MMKHVSLFITLIVLFPCSIVVAQTDAERVQAFILESKRLPVAERIQRASETMQVSEDQVVVGEAARDLARFSKTPERAQAALAEIDALIQRSPSGSYTFRWGNLAKARVLARMDRKDEALAIFKTAITECWDKNVYREFFETCGETGQFALMAVEEYNRQAGDEYSDEVREFHGLGDDLIDVLCHLRSMRADRPDSLAVQEILPQLKESNRRPLAGRIAKALCLSADDRYDEALTELDQIQAVLSSEDAPVSDRDESKDLPLYRTAVLLFQGQDYEAARDAFREYMARNADDPEHLLFRSRNLAYGMDETPNEIRTIAEFTQVLVNSDLMATKEARAKLPQNLAASILEKHRESLAWRLEPEESCRIAMLIMDEYYPQTLSGANAAMNFAAYIALDKGDIDGGKRLLNHILENAPYDGVVPHVKRVLAQIALREKNPDQAMELTNETLERVGPLPEGGPLKRCLENALKTKAAATSLKNPEGAK
ncbi:MAG TPA: hypothetical protein PLQ35_02170 [bacterium]|nr:hypothetical protein [bacterium]HQL61078.1 hypothetical protein [bacterium]